MTGRFIKDQHIKLDTERITQKLRLTQYLKTNQKQMTMKVRRNKIQMQTTKDTRYEKNVSEQKITTYKILKKF